MKSIIPSACSFCGSKRHATPFAGGEWQTPIGNVFCCHTCAVNVLPAFIADSVHINGNHYTLGRERLEVVEKSFWKAMTARASRGQTND